MYFRKGIKLSASRAGDRACTAGKPTTRVTPMRNTVPCTHVILLVPDVPLTVGCGDGPVTPLMVVPGPHLKLSPRMWVEHHGLWSLARIPIPLHNVAVHLALLQIAPPSGVVTSVE